MRILIVEDSEIAAKVGTKLLTELDCQTEHKVHLLHHEFR